MYYSSTTQQQQYTKFSFLSRSYGKQKHTSREEANSDTSREINLLFNAGYNNHV